MVICAECKQPECVAIYGDDGCYEYALLDEDNQTIIYIFTQWEYADDKYNRK